MGLGITRTLEDLAATEGGTPKPEPEGIACLVEAVVDRYFKQHKRAETQTIELFVFGFSAIDLTPWLWKIVHKSGKGTTKTSLSLGADDFHVIGNITTSTGYMRRVGELRKRIKKHKEKLREQQGEDAHFELQLEKARHESADNNAVEDETLAQIENEFANGVGGILQKMEAFEVGGRTSISFTRDNGQHILDGLPVIGRPGLGYVPIGEKMGRK